MENARQLRWPGYLLLAGFAFVLFGYCGISGRPLTMHEARLPQTARQMIHDREWLLPHSGNRPWLERPPLPHWIVIGTMKMFRSDDTEWVARLPSALMGVIVVLLTGWISNRWFGRNIALLSGTLLASSFEFYRYAGAAEDDIYLAALVSLCMALFVATEFPASDVPIPDRHPFFGRRNAKIMGFFAVLGLTNFAKGPLLGLAIVGSTVGPYLIWAGFFARQWKPLLRYTWFWGWIVLIGLTLSWPMWAYHHYPDVLANWKYDYVGRVNGAYSDINQAWWYYIPTLAVAMLPWTPACLIGLSATAGRLFDRSAEALTSRRAMVLLWCWAFAPLILFSIPRGKHHHYLVPLLVPWAILAGVGMSEIGKFLLARKRSGPMSSPLIGMLILGLPAAADLIYFRGRIPCPTSVIYVLAGLCILICGVIFLALRRGNGPLLYAAVLLIAATAYCWGETYVAARTDKTVDDTAFLRRVRNGEVPADEKMFIDAKLGNVGNLDFFRIQFYSDPRAILLHNLSFLRDEKIKDSRVMVICRARDLAKLMQLGTVRLVDQSANSHEIEGPPGRFTLFELTFAPNLQRYPAPVAISNLQAMERRRALGVDPRCEAILEQIAARYYCGFANIREHSSGPRNKMSAAGI